MLKIDGKALSAKLRAELKQKTEQICPAGKRPGLAVIIVGEDPASRVYVNNKKRACAEIGFYSEEYALPAETTTEQLLGLIAELNTRSSIHGILCQLPLPKGIDEKAVLQAIAPEKDVDAFHPENVGHIMIGDAALLSCTPAGVMYLLQQSGVELSGKNAVVIGRSNIVGKPMAMLLLQQNATVTVCHSRTQNLKQVVRQADVVVAAVGKAKLITKDYIKPGAVVIDVGMNRDENGKLCGDVDYNSVVEVCSAITPVPGGVGPMTIAMLMQNTLTAFCRQNNIEQCK